MNMYIDVLSFHLQLRQAWQACEGSVLNRSDGIVMQIPISKHIPSQTTQAPNIIKMEKNTVWEVYR